MATSILLSADLQRLQSASLQMENKFILSKKIVKNLTNKGGQVKKPPGEVNRTEVISTRLNFHAIATTYIYNKPSIELSQTTISQKLLSEVKISNESKYAKQETENRTLSRITCLRIRQQRLPVKFDKICVESNTDIQFPRQEF